MKILLTNDDGIDAPGLSALRESVQLALRIENIAAEIVTIAPDRGRSECGHSVTQNRALTLKRLGATTYSLDGTPADCVRVALGKVSPDVEVVFSGVNAGANLGIDLLVSGTFAAVREAASHGIAGMAISHYRKPDVPKLWDHVPEWSREPIRQFLSVIRHPSDTSAATKAEKPTLTTQNPPPLWNVNLPALQPNDPPPQVVYCDVGRLPHQRTVRRDPADEPNRPINGRSAETREIRFDMDFHDRPREEGCDVDQCFRGNLTISKLSFSVP